MTLLHQAVQKTVEAVKAAQRTINSMKVEAETAAAGGDEQMLQDACETISAEGLEADMELRAAIAALSAIQHQEEPREPVALTRESLADIVREHLGDVYICTRVWNAWNVGTMGQDDFEPADESLLAEDIADAVLAASPSTTRQQEVGSGWKLVPVEPTCEMIRAASVIRATMVDAGEWCVGIGGAIDAYEAMLAAAPSTPKKAGDGKEVSCG